MTEFFNFLREIPPYSETANGIKRLNQRYKLVIEPFLPQINGSRVLDLACHDGRWSYALAAAGAREVVGVEARKELLDRFESFPDNHFKARVNLICDDLFSDLEARNTRGETFDVIALYGIFYHVMDHFRVLSLVSNLRPSLIIIDSEFIVTDNAMIQVLKEEVSNPLNAISKGPNQTHTIVGVPSKRATEFMANALNYNTFWVDHALLLRGDRGGMHDYFRDGRKIRHTCGLFPQDNRL